MDIAVVPPSASHHIKMAYKKYDLYHLKGCVE